jgi:hypothetical protein
MTAQVGQIISGYQNELGVTLNKIAVIEDDTMQIEVVLYEPDDPQFTWALEQLSSLEET